MGKFIQDHPNVQDLNKLCKMKPKLESSAEFIFQS